MSAVRRAVIVSTARTGLAKSFRGGFNKTHGAALAGVCLSRYIVLYTSRLASPHTMFILILGAQFVKINVSLFLYHFNTGHAIKSAIEKAGIDKGLVDDVIMGCGMPEGKSQN